MKYCQPDITTTFYMLFHNLLYSRIIVLWTFFLVNEFYSQIKQHTQEWVFISICSHQCWIFQFFVLFFHLCKAHKGQMISPCWFFVCFIIYIFLFVFCLSLIVWSKIFLYIYWQIFVFVVNCLFLLFASISIRIFIFCIYKNFLYNPLFYINIANIYPNIPPL